MSWSRLADLRKLRICWRFSYEGLIKRSDSFIFELLGLCVWNAVQSLRICEIEMASVVQNRHWLFIGWENRYSCVSFVCPSRSLMILVISFLGKLQSCAFIPVTLRGYTRFFGKYVTGRRKRFRPHKVHIYILDQDH